MTTQFTSMWRPAWMRRPPTALADFRKWVAAQHVWLQGFSALTRTNDVDFVEVLEGHEDG
jgi:hypothetical protein